MTETGKKRKKLPGIGMRIIKSAVAVLLCFGVYLLRRRTGIPFYSALAALWCLQPYVSNSLKMAAQRTIGTLIGAVFGIVVLVAELYVFPIHDALAGYLVSSLMLIPILYTTVLMKQKSASYFSCVVFLSITVTHLTDANPFVFALNRVLDTLIGVGVGLLVNTAALPRRRDRETLFVAELDYTLLANNDNISGYSMVELNRLTDSGMRFTIATMRTPTSLREVGGDIRLPLPVVAMDGAVIYDMQENSYLKCYIISPETTRELIDFAEARLFHCFTNVILDDVLLIYYGELRNPAEEQIYRELHISPYRNYLKRPVPAGQGAVYLMLVDTDARIQWLCEELERAGYAARLRLVTYASERQSGYTHLKIYNKNVSRERMLAELCEMTHAPRVITLGNQSCDVQVGDGNALVKQLKRLYGGAKPRSSH